MTPEEKFDQKIWETLMRIKERHLYAKTGEPVSISTALVNKEVLEKLEEWDSIKIRYNPWKIPASTENIFYLDIRPKFSHLFEKYEGKSNKKINEKSVISIKVFPIKDIRLDSRNYFLEINKGEKIVSFKSKKKAEGFEKETKLFKILFQLWDFRRELKNDKIIEKGDFVSLDNLSRGSGTENSAAVYKQIQRLNKLFEKENLAIHIKGENEKYRLIINKI
jgi:hypothetical protein